jgi:spore maturation protein CgeB
MMAGLNKFSSALRGQLISTIKDYNVNIFGGDLSYGRINDPLLIIRQSNILYKPATIDYQSASVIYQSSKINLNISALQFDTAINNRFFDIVSSGGFVLTDKRKDLEKVSSEISELVFETPEEMIYKISFYMNPRNDSKRKEIIEYTQSLVLKEYSYSILCDFILKNVSKYEINS